MANRCVESIHPVTDAMTGFPFIGDTISSIRIHMLPMVAQVTRSYIWRSRTRWSDQSIRSVHLSISSDRWFHPTRFFVPSMLDPIHPIDDSIQILSVIQSESYRWFNPNPMSNWCVEPILAMHLIQSFHLTMSLSDRFHLMIDDSISSIPSDQ